MEHVVVIVAGGSGLRMKSELPKQFMPLGNLPVLMHTMLKFKEFNPDISIRVVLPENQIMYWKQLCSKNSFNVQHEIFTGGDTRFHSVKNGISGIDNTALVGIQDGVRPLVSVETIKRCYTLAQKTGAAVPVIELEESIRKIEGDNSVAVPRTNYRMVQTPQVFRSEILLKAYNTEFSEHFTDDASVVEAAGFKVALAKGNTENLKITTQKDLLLAEALLSKLVKTIR